jgi:hypothetical protein
MGRCEWMAWRWSTHETTPSIHNALVRWVRAPGSLHKDMLLVWSLSYLHGVAGWPPFSSNNSQQRGRPVPLVCRGRCPCLVHSKFHSITPVATKVHVTLRSLVVLTWMRDTNELVLHVTLWNNTKCNILMMWCGALHLAFPCNVAYACTNIQQVA